MQTVQTQIRLLLKEQSDQGLHCLPSTIYFKEQLMHKKAKSRPKTYSMNCSKFEDIYGKYGRIILPYLYFTVNWF